MNGNVFCLIYFGFSYQGNYFFLMHEKAPWKLGTQNSTSSFKLRMVLEFKLTKGIFCCCCFCWDLFSRKSPCSLGKAEVTLCPNKSQTVSLKITFSVHGDVNLLPVLSCLATGYRRIFFSRFCKSSRLWDQDMYIFNQPPSNFPSAFHTFPSHPSWWFSSWSLDLLKCPSH